MAFLNLRLHLHVLMLFFLSLSYEVALRYQFFTKREIRSLYIAKKRYAVTAGGLISVFLIVYIK